MNKQDLIDFEKKIGVRFDNGEIPYLTHFSGGNEDQLIDIFKDINTGDWVLSTHRSHYHYLLAGGDPNKLEKLIVNGKSMFVFDKALNFYSSSIVAATPAVAAGIAWALKRNNSDKKVWCFIGDGAEDEGHLCEASRYVDGWDLPCTFIIEDNDRSVSSTKAERWGNYKPLKFDCLKRYSYIPTYPHGGTNTPGWVKFKIKPVLEKEIKKTGYNLHNGISKEGYKQAVKDSMERLAKENYIFIGYNVKHGSAYETLTYVPSTQKIETPLAENLMAGIAVGISLEGFKPVLYFERHDFIFNALDIIVNQIDKIKTISNNEFNFPIIIKTVVGGTSPFYAGVTHTSDYTEVFRKLFNFPVLYPGNATEVLYAYTFAMAYNAPVLISERKELY